MSNLWYISPSDQRSNYGVDDYGTEEERMNQMADAIVPHLERCGVRFHRADRNLPIDDRPAEANAMVATHYVALHSNGGGSRGVEVYYYSAEGLARKFADAVLALGQKNLRSSNVKQQQGFYELYSPDATAVLIETDYHDHSDGVRFIVDRMEQIAEAYAKVIVAEDGREWIPAGTAPAVPSDGRYDTVEQMPAYAQPTIRKLVDKGMLQGKKDGSLDLSEDMIRMLVIHDRAGLYDN